MSAGLTSPTRDNNPKSDISPSSWAETLAGCVAFLLFGGLTMIQYGLPLREPYPWIELDTVIFWGSVLFASGMVAFAWIKNFPRWSYPYVALTLLFAVVICFSYPAACLPLLLMIALTLFVTRLGKPLFRLIDQGLEDWTLFAFGAFGTLPFWMETFCDQVEPSYAIPWLMALTLFMTVIALAYLRSPRFWQRSLVITAGLFLTAIAFIIGPTPFVFKNDLTYLATMIFAVGILMLVLLSPVLVIKLIHLWTRP